VSRFDIKFYHRALYHIEDLLIAIADILVYCVDKVRQLIKLLRKIKPLTFLKIFGIIFIIVILSY
jgi:hypothetical protein